MNYGTYYIIDGFTRKVSLVVLAIDDFTDKPILGSNVRIYIEGEAPPIRNRMVIMFLLTWISH